MNASVTKLAVWNSVLLKTLMQRLIFEQSPFLVLICLVVAIGSAYFLYRQKHSWGIWTNRLLFLFRATLIFFICFLLLGPIIKLIINNEEKPEIVFLIDDSRSVRETVDSVKIQAIMNQLNQIAGHLEEEAYDVTMRGLANESFNSFTTPTSDINSALHRVEADYDGRNLASVVLLSDGIYNTGVSPLYSIFKTPIHTIGIGDTIQKRDIVLHTVRYNKVAYQGNKFPVRAEVLAHAMPDQEIPVTIYKNGKAIATERKPSGISSLLVYDFTIDADKAGIQRFDIVAQVSPSETNPKNNATSVFVEVIEGKKKILVVAPAPHPDIKALRSVIEKNPNYELTLHMPGVKDAEPDLMRPEKVDLVIFHQAPDNKGSTLQLVKQFTTAGTPTFMILGQQSNLRLLPSLGIDLTFESAGQWDEVFGIPADDFSTFDLPENLNNSLARYPPLITPFGKFGFPPDAKTVLQQRIGSVPTNRPLLWYADLPTARNGTSRFALLAGEGIWRWRLKEYDLSETTVTFDSFFSKLIQFLSSKEDKRKFRCFPVKQQFNDTEYVVFESQIFNEVFEPQFGSMVSIDVVDEKGAASKFTYTPTENRPRYQFGLPAGVYKYSAWIERDGKRETDGGQFSVTPLQVESQNLTADFQLLRTLSSNTGGNFFTANTLTTLETRLKNQKAPTIVHSDETFHPLIDLKSLFIAIMILVSTEWFFRKYLGSY